MATHRGLHDPHRHLGHLPGHRRAGRLLLYIGDRKLATRDNMDHIAAKHGRFLTVSRSRKEDDTGRDWLASGSIGWAEISRRAGKRKTDPPEVWWAVPAPTPSAEGYRIVWMRSSTKRAHDAMTRADRIGRAAAIGELSTSLASARCRLKSRIAVEDAARAMLTDTRAARWVRFEVGEQVGTEYRQGRPGRTRYRRIDRTRFTLSFSVDSAQVATDAASDGCFPFATLTTRR